MFKKFLVVSPLLLIMSCASLSEDSCRAENWGAIGFNDGKNGRLESYINQHREACADYGITPDVTTWLKTRVEGLKHYCTPENAYSVGRRGRDLSPVCETNESNLRLANFYGQRYYEISEEIDDIDDEMDEILRKLSADFNGELTPEQRALQRFYLSEVRELRREIRDLDWELRRYDELP